MKSYKVIAILSAFLFLPPVGLANNQSVQNESIEVAQANREVASSRRRTNRTRSKKYRRRTSQDSQLLQALKLAKQKNYVAASQLLFRLSHNSKYASKKMQIKYILGLMLYEMKLNQVAAFQFVNVVKDGRNRYLRQALEKMSLAANELGDDTLLNYALGKVKVREFPLAHRDMLYYRIGEFQHANQAYSAAIKSLDNVDAASIYYPKAKYLQAMSYAEQGKNNSAIRKFEQLVNTRADRGITDPARVAGVIGKARTYYQARQWDDAIRFYREVPRDTPYYHEALFEMSWAMLRSGRFRSALSNFHTLHSAYYEYEFQPESLLLRSIIYLYICKFDEMEKVLNLFSKIYQPVFRSVKSYIDNGNRPLDYFDQIITVEKYLEGGLSPEQWNLNIPYIVAKRIYKEGDVQRINFYIKKLENEFRILNSKPPAWKNSAIGRYSKKVLATRLIKAKQKMGRMAKKHMITVQAELFDLFEQQDFIRFEMLKGKKNTLKAQLAGKADSAGVIDQDNERDFYIQNGYEYWPFKGEFWLDEIGNYHYLGVSSCGQ